MSRIRVPLFLAAAMCLLLQPGRADLEYAYGPAICNCLDQPLEGVEICTSNDMTLFSGGRVKGGGPGFEVSGSSSVTVHVGMTICVPLPPIPPGQCVYMLYVLACTMSEPAFGIGLPTKTCVVVSFAPQARPTSPWECL